MTCDLCTAAESDPFRGGRYDDACLGCQARRLALSPACFRAIRGDYDDLIAAIKPIWKDDLEAGRTAVWEWVMRMRDAARKAKGDQG